MNKVKDINGLKSRLRPKLRNYLETAGTAFSSNGQSFSCPNRAFHANNDEKPSCGFFPDESSWHCFVCNMNGDIFLAAHLLEEKPKDGPQWVPQTLLYLADLLKVTVEFEEPTPEEKEKAQVYEVLKVAAELAHQGLKKSEAAMTYVKGRGWESVAGDFLLGYCSYDKLVEILSQKGYTTDVMIRAGIIHKEMLDRRLLFPIKDFHGRVVGFSSRWIKDDESPKYINSSSSSVYQKSETLYNLYRISGDSVWVVEGLADVVSLYQKGIKNVVGLCGTSFTPDHVKILAKKGIKSIILCLDTDAAGSAAEDLIMGRLRATDGLTICIKVKDECKDPDACLQKHDFLLTSNCRTMFDHYIEKYKKTDARSDRDKALRAILLERSRIDQEQLCKKAAKELDVRLEVIQKEFDQIIEKEGDQVLITAADVLREKSLFERAVLNFEQLSKDRGQLLGLSCGFPIFTEDMDGLQDMVYLFAGEQGTGKSAFTRNLAMNVIKAEPEKAFILFVSIDETTDELIARLIAMESGLEINAVKNPKYKILNNSAYTEGERQRLMDKYSDAIKRVRSLSSHMAIKDEIDVRNISDIEKYIRTYKEIAEGRKLVVIIDSLHRIRVPKKFHSSMREDTIEISDALKRWRNDFKIPVLATAELRKLNQKGMRPTADDLKEASDLKYDADSLGLMYNDIGSQGMESADLKFLDGEIFYPIVEINYGHKNRTSSFKGRHYYRFFSDFHKMIECSREEMSRYHRIAFPIEGARVQ